MDIRIDRPEWQSALFGDENLDGANADLSQAGQALSTLALEFGSSGSPDEIPALLSGLRQLMNAGLPVPDIADALYGTPGVLKALKDGDPEAAKELLIPQLTASLAELRGSGVPENLLHFLGESGFGAAEIASALGSLPELRDELLQGAPAEPEALLTKVRDFFRSSGRITHQNASLMDTHPTLAWSGAPGSWFDEYEERIRGAQKQRLRATLWEDESGVVLPLSLTSPPQKSSKVSDWLIGGLLVIAGIVVAASHYCGR